jgi:hypothetical protein
MLRLSAMILCAALFAAATTSSAQEAALPTAAGSNPRLEVDTRIAMGPILLTSFSAVAVAVGAGFGWQAHQDYEDWKEARDTGDPFGDMDGIADDVRAHSIAADILMFGGAVGAVVGIVWWVAAAKRRKAEEPGRGAVSVRPFVGPAEAGAIVEF